MARAGGVTVDAGRRGAIRDRDEARVGRVARFERSAVGRVSAAR